MSVCPTCGQKLPTTRKRVCGKCLMPIRRHDRWHFEGSQCLHNDCEKPRFRISQECPLQFDIMKELTRG